MSDQKRRVVVSRRELMAAELAVEIARKRGREPDPLMLRIVNAKPIPADEQKVPA